MSPLTKLFVVLQVVMSLLLTAGTVVYVTRDNQTVDSLAAARASLAAAENAAAQNASALSAAQTNLLAQQESNNQMKAASAQAIAAAEQRINDLNVQLAKANANSSTQELQIARLTEGLQAAQSTTSCLTQTVAQLRTSGDQLIKRASEDSARISELASTLEVTERNRRELAEQLAELRQNGGSAVSAAGRQGPVAAPAINGIIRDRRNIGGKEYATISVGSADNVQRGMQFKVIDRGNFLGTLTVDAVEANEATGILAGPHVNDIAKGSEVRTQY